MSALSVVISGLVAIVTGLFVIRLWPKFLPPSPCSGERGQRRKEALKTGALFRAGEWGLRGLAGMVSPICTKGLLARAEALTARTGFVLGLDGRDLVSLSVLGSGVGAILCGGMLSALERSPGAGVVVGIVFGGVFPWLKLQDISKRRLITISRGLPGVLDLVVLAMESGLDFPGAIRQVTVRLDPKNPIRFELAFILQKLVLGWSRRSALEALADRVPILPVRQFTSSVIQAEKRGTPLKEVLATQAGVMRRKRSENAEQAAARAAVMIIGPLMLIFACVFAIILGPFVVRYLRGELF